MRFPRHIPSVDEIRVRGSQLIWARLERMQLSSPKPTIVRGGLTRIAGPPWLVSGEEQSALNGPADIAKRVAIENPEIPPRWYRHMALAGAGMVDVLGLGPLQVGNPPDWHRDVTSGVRAPRLHWSKIPTLDVSVVGDHKVVWEINRHQYLLAPALCWLRDGSPVALSLVYSHLQSWLQENPSRYGINWASSLEVGYRAITWCWLLWLLRDAPWDQTLRSHIIRSLEEHALHVERYPSTYFSPNTHLTGEALSLFYVGTCLPESAHSSRWRLRGHRYSRAVCKSKSMPTASTLSRRLRTSAIPQRYIFTTLPLAEALGGLFPTLSLLESESYWTCCEICVGATELSRSLVMTMAASCYHWTSEPRKG